MLDSMRREYTCRQRDCCFSKQKSLSIHVCMYVYILIYIYTYINMFVFTSICQQKCHMYIFTLSRMYIRTYICLNVPTQSSKRVLQKVSRVLLNSLAEVACLRQYIHTYIILYTNVHTYLHSAYVRSYQTIRDTKGGSCLGKQNETTSNLFINCGNYTIQRHAAFFNLLVFS